MDILNKLYNPELMNVNDEYRLAKLKNKFDFIASLSHEDMEGFSFGDTVKYTNDYGVVF